MSLFLRYFLENLLVRFQRDRLRAELLCLNDHALRDAGFSRELLLEGVRAWPWQSFAEEDLTGLDLGQLDDRRRRIIRAGMVAATTRDVLVA